MWQARLSNYTLGSVVQSATPSAAAGSDVDQRVPVPLGPVPLSDRISNQQVCILLYSPNENLAYQYQCLLSVPLNFRFL
jgi:hypothetical protein